MSKCPEEMGPGPGARDPEGAAPESRAAEVGVGKAVMERARTAPVFVQIAARKPLTSWELPV